MTTDDTSQPFSLLRVDRDYDRVSAYFELPDGQRAHAGIKLNGHGGGSIQVNALDARGWATDTPFPVDATTMRLLLKDLGFEHLSEMKEAQAGDGGKWAFSYPLKPYAPNPATTPLKISELAISKQGMAEMQEWAQRTGEATGMDWDLEALASHALTNPRSLETSIGNRHYLVPGQHVVPASLVDAPHNEPSPEPVTPGGGIVVKQYFSSEELGMTNLTWAADNGETYSVSAHHMDMDKGTNWVDFMQHSNGHKEVVNAPAANVVNAVMTEVRAAVNQGRGLSEDFIEKLDAADLAIQSQIAVTLETYQRAREDSAIENAACERRHGISSGMGM